MNSSYKISFQNNNQTDRQTHTPIYIYTVKHTTEHNSMTNRQTDTQRTYDSLQNPKKKKTAKNFVSQSILHVRFDSTVVLHMCSNNKLDPPHSLPPFSSMVIVHDFEGFLFGGFKWKRKIPCKIIRISFFFFFLLSQLISFILYWYWYWFCCHISCNFVVVKDSCKISPVLSAFLSYAYRLQTIWRNFRNYFNKEEKHGKIMAFLS